MFNIHSVEIDWGGRPLRLETGKIARQADGAVLATYGETVVLASGVAADIPLRQGQAAQTVTIFDRSDPEKRKKQALKAGQQHVVSFKNP